MSKKIIISTVSGEGLPNMLIIKNNLDAEYFINIVSEKMKDKFNYMKETVEKIDKSLSSKFKRISVNNSIESNIQLMEEALNNNTEYFNNADEIIVNLTGGTKLMGIALYSYFNKFYSDKTYFVYMDIYSSSNKYILLNKETPYNEKNTIMDINIKEYLTPYGIKIINENEPSKSEIDSEDVIKNALNIEKSYPDNNKISYYKKSFSKVTNNIKKDDIYKIYTINELLNQNKISDKDKINFKKYIKLLYEKNIIKNNNEISVSEIKYVISGFLEEYIYYIIKSILPEKENIKDYLKMSVEIKIKNKNNNQENQQQRKDKPDQELDVIFMHNNIMHYIECKTYADEYIIQNSLYKQAAISKKMGLKTKNYFITLGRFDEKINNKMELFNIKYICINDTENFKNILKENIINKNN